MVPPKITWVADRGISSSENKDVAGNLKVKELRIAEDERFVICFNPVWRKGGLLPRSPSRARGQWR
jgi:hypothetical protein